MRLLLKFLLGLALVWVAGFVWFMLTLPGPVPAETKTDGIVVLTGGPGRLAHGVDIIRSGGAQRLLVSGVDPVVRPVDLASELDVEEDLFACCIDLGKRAADTAGNGAEIAAWARQRGYTSLRVVTAADHMPRALLELDGRLDDGVEIVPDAVPVAGGAISLAREYTKFAVRRLIGLVESA
ncbi:YdcF family protein [Pacificimonas pallii]|nr:YdcF family protein [Pacificimonas pallii]